MSDIREAEGILFIGDPHLSSRKPGRRRDESFADTVLGKIDYLIGQCNERRLLPVFLGDMFDTAVEEDEQVKTRLARVLRKSWTLPLSNVGNHDIRNAVLTDGDSLAFLAETGVIRVCAHSGAFETVRIGGKTVGLGATPYGQPIPTDARPHFGQVDMIVWLTHHDVAFENAYPGSMAPHAVAGCRLVVNGHMHLYKKPLKVGATVWFNPGNITRQAIDAIEHVPAAYALTAKGNLDKVEVPHERAVFDLTGKLIGAISPGEVPRPEAQEGDSAFVNLLKADSSLEMARTDDGSVLLEEIVAKFSREGTPEEVKAIVMDLHSQAVA